MSGPASTLYHMVELARWRDYQAGQQPYLPPTYQQDGFIHLTADPALLLTVANHFYQSVPGEWAVLVIDQASITGGEVKYEPAAPVGDQQSSGLLKGSGEDGVSEQQEQQEEGPLFPHLYGPLNLDSVVRELPMVRSPDGAFLSIEGLLP